jgi:hypothetical protein
MAGPKATRQARKARPIAEAERETKVGPNGTTRIHNVKETVVEGGRGPRGGGGE